MKRAVIPANSQTKKMGKAWRFCVGSGHAALALRQDYQEQLRFIHDELGIERVRFHGIFCDDMNVIQRFSDFIPIPGSKKYTTQSFYQVGVVYDAVLKAGMKPFVELSFMPAALASKKRTLFHYKGNVTPPKDYGAWGKFIEDFIRFLFHRYGREEVLTWYFEVWNEPDLRLFWAGSQKDYFRFYKSTARAIKAADERLMVGGPSTSASRWLPEMLDFCERERVPIDFLSTHQYPGDAIGIPYNLKTVRGLIKRYRESGTDTLNKKIRNLTYSDEMIAKYPKNYLTERLRYAREIAGELPLFYTEWNCCATCTAPVHDTRQSAALAVKTVMDNWNLADGYAHWSFSDIFEELFFFPEPFSGSFGLLTIHGIAKPSFWGYKLLSQLGEERLILADEQGGDIEYAIFKKEGCFQILAYHQEYLPGDGKKQAASFTLRDAGATRRVTVQSIDEINCNPLRVWEEMGSPLNLLPEQVAKIKEKSKLCEEPLAFRQDGADIIVETALGVNDIQLITVYI